MAAKRVRFQFGFLMALKLFASLARRSVAESRLIEAIHVRFPWHTMLATAASESPPKFTAFAPTELRSIHRAIELLVVRAAADG